MGVPAFSPDYQHQNDDNNQSEYTNNNDYFGMICKENKSRKKIETEYNVSKRIETPRFLVTTTKQ